MEDVIEDAIKNTIEDAIENVNEKAIDTEMLCLCMTLCRTL